MYSSFRHEWESLLCCRIGKWRPHSSQCHALWTGAVTITLYLIQLACGAGQEVGDLRSLEAKVSKPGATFVKFWSQPRSEVSSPSSSLCLRSATLPHPHSILHCAIKMRFNVVTASALLLGAVNAQDAQAPLESETEVAPKPTFTVRPYQTNHKHRG